MILLVLLMFVTLFVVAAFNAFNGTQDHIPYLNDSSFTEWKETVMFTLGFMDPKLAC